MLSCLAPVAAMRPTSDHLITYLAPVFGSACDPPRSADALACLAAATLANEGSSALAVFDAFPGALYAIDIDGALTYSNAACSVLAGKAPTSANRWCVCDVLRDLDGVAIDPDHGPNAQAMRLGTPIRGLEALVERPDGERSAVRPHPTPAIDRDGHVVGLVSLVVLLDGVRYRELLATALRCTTLAKWIGDDQARDALAEMAIECEQHARVLSPA